MGIQFSVQLMCLFERIITIFVCQCVCVCACVRACVRVRVRACVRVWSVCVVYIYI